MTAMRLTVFVAALLVAGCIQLGSYRYTPTTRNVAAVRRPSCAFDLLTARPDQPFFELGVLERPTDPARDESGLPARTAAQFRQVVAEQVCRVGGDAVLTEVNGFGSYIRGTVIKYRDAAPEPPEEAAAPPLPPLPPVPAGSSPATVTVASAEIRTAPFKVAPVVSVVPMGQWLFVQTTATDGWRAATLFDGRRGFVEDEQVKVPTSTR